MDNVCIAPLIKQWVTSSDMNCRTCSTCLVQFWTFQRNIKYIKAQWDKLKSL